MSVASVFRGKEYPYQRNSLNMFRLALAFLVLFAHGFYTAGAGWSPGFNGENLGGWAVIGFFVLSGFLITRSRFRTSAGDYILHRVARIYPAFIVCLLVTIIVFGPIAQFATYGSFSGYLTNGPTPAQYVWGNLFLHVSQYQIGDSLATVPYPNAWNGSLWTLAFEFICYLAVWALGGLAIYRRSIVFVGLIWAGSVAVRAAQLAGVNGGLDSEFDLLARLLPYFMGGSLLYLIIDRWGVAPVIGWITIPTAAAMIVFIPGLGGPLGAPVIGYALLYLSTVIPQPAWIARNDISYGFYIYAWPIQQLVVIFGGAEFGIIAYTLICAAVTAIAAIGSWMLIERPVMRMVRRPRSARKASAASRES